MIANGCWGGSSTLVAGPSGSGKTILGLHFLREGANRGEPGLYVGFQENPSRMARIMLNLGWNATKLLENGLRAPVSVACGDAIRQRCGRSVRASSRREGRASGH